PAAARGAAVFCQFARQRLDNIEDCADVAFVVRQDQVRRDRVCDDQNVFRKQRFERYRSVWGNLLVFVRSDLDLCRFLLPLRKTSDDAPIEISYYFVLLRRGHPKQDGDAETEKHRKRTAFDTKSQRRG